MAYLNIFEIESALQNLAAGYPETTELVACPNVTHEGRQSHVLRVGAKQDVAVDGVLILGGVHAREWVPPDALVSLTADLLEAYKLGTGLVYGGKRFSANDVRQVMDTLNLFIYPCVNPDGRHYSQTNEALWRKNRRPPPSNGSCVGVDINRNFDFLWEHLTKFASDAGVNTSEDPCNKQVYRGPSSSSEPETKNVVWLLDTYPRIRWHVDMHSAVPTILHSWGSDQNQTTEPAQTFLNSGFDSVRGRPDDAAYGEYITQEDLTIVETLSHRMNEAVKAVRSDNYGVEQAFGLYPTSGASDDYAFSRHFADPSKAKVYGFTVECGHSFQPAWSEAEEVIREVSAGLIAFCLEASASPPDDMSLLQAKGKVIFLRAHEVGTGWGPPQDFLDVEAVVRLDTAPDMGFGFQLRADANEEAHREMFNLLRTAFRRNRRVRIDYYIRTGTRNGRVIRVMDIP